MYREIGYAMRRLNTRKPFQRISEEWLKDMVLDVVEVRPGGFRSYRGYRDWETDRKSVV